MSIRQARGLRFSSADIDAKELTFQGTLGAHQYVFDTSTCEPDFGLTHGVLYEFYFDANSAQNDEVPATPAGLVLPPKNRDSQAFLGRYFIAVGTMKTPLDLGDEASGPAPSSGTVAPAAAAAAAAADGTPAAAHVEPPSLYIYDVEELSLFNLSETHNSVTLRERYPLRPVDEESARRFFECQILEAPYGFITRTLQEKYYVRSGETVYLSTLGETAQIIGECFGCLWVKLGASGRVTALGKATNEARLVTLYGLSDVSNAPAQPGQQPVVTPRSVQTPRATNAGPPFTLNKKTADGKPAVLCNCPMNLQVLAVCSADALKLFGVRPMTRIFFTLGVDAGKSATILGVRNGNLYIHIDGEQKCTCLRNATNAEELRERYTGSGGGGDSAAGIPPTASAKTMPKDLPKEVGSGSPMSIPKLSLGGIGEKMGNMFGGSPSGGSQTPKPGPSSSSSPQPSGSQSRSIAGTSPAGGAGGGGASPSRGFHFWTPHGCLQFDISTDACRAFSLRHGQTVRFSAGVDAGCIFHVVGVRGGNIWVVADRGDFALPLRHCSNAEEVQERVGPVLVGTTRLRSADPRGVPPLQQTMRSPDRRAGSPFGISPRNTQHEDEEGNAVEFGRLSNPNSAARASREINFVSESGGALNSNSTSGGEFGTSSSMAQPRISIQKSMSPGARGGSDMNSAASGVYGTREQSDPNVANAAQASMSRYGSADAVLGAPRALNRRGSFSMDANASVSNVDALIAKPSIHIHVPDEAAASSSAHHSPAADRLTTAINRNTMISPPGPVVTDAFKSTNMPATRIYLKAIALRALGVKREQDMPTAFFRFFSHDAGSNLSKALAEMPKFVTYWDQREKPMRGGRSFGEATADMMVEAMENLAQLRGEN